SPRPPGTRTARSGGPAPRRHANGSRLGLLLARPQVFLGQDQLLVIVAAQVVRPWHVALMDDAVIEAERLAQRERRGPGEGAAGDRADVGDELDDLARR